MEEIVFRHQVFSAVEETLRLFDGEDLPNLTEILWLGGVEAACSETSMELNYATALMNVFLSYLRRDYPLLACLEEDLFDA